MSNIDISRDVIEMPALGQNFVLGTFYDAVQNKIVGLGLLREREKVRTTQNSHTESLKIMSDELTEKFREQNVDASIQVNILTCDKFNTSGSAKFLEKKKNTGLKSIVHLQCRFQTAFKTLIMDDLDYQYDKIKDMIPHATHLVTQIQYGATAIFTFSMRFTEKDCKFKVNSQLEICVQKFCSLFGVKTEVGGSSATTGIENENDIECCFNGDFRLPDDVKAPTRYKEAFEFAQKFCSSSSKWMDKDPENENQSLGVPITVWLTPLVTMPGCHEAPVLRYEIPSWMASKCVSFMVDYDKVEERLHGLLQDPLVKKLIPLEKKLQWFKEYLDTYLEVLRLKLREIVVNFRSGQTTALDSFRQLVSQIENEDFIFHYERLDGWLHRKFSELTLVKKFIEDIETKIGKRECLIFPSPETLKEKMTNYPAKFGYEFSFSFTARPEEFLERLKRTVMGTDIFNEIAISTETNNSNDKHWYESSSVFERIQSEIDIFVKLVKSNTNDEKFAITATDNYDENRVNQFSIIVHNKQETLFGLSAMEYCYTILQKHRIKT